MGMECPNCKAKIERHEYYEHFTACFNTTDEILGDLDSTKEGKRKLGAVFPEDWKKVR